MFIMTSKALILVDYEKEWTNKESDYYVGDISEVIQRTNQLIDFCRKNDYKIIFIQHIEEGSEGAFVENTQNVEFFDELHVEESDSIITKYRISPFYKTALDKELEGIDEIIASGILTNLCLRSLVQDAYDRDFDIKIIKDCCTAFDEETHEFTFKDLKATREEIEFLDLNDFLK